MRQCASVHELPDPDAEFLGSASEPHTNASLYILRLDPHSTIPDSERMYIYLPEAHIPISEETRQQHRTSTSVYVVRALGCRRLDLIRAPSTPSHTSNVNIINLSPLQQRLGLRVASLLL